MVTLGDEVFHYTSSKNVDSILREGLIGRKSLDFPRGRVFTTPNGSLSPIQAQLDLALSPNIAPNALFRVDLNVVRQLGLEISTPRQVGRLFNLPGGGTEVIIYGRVPSSALTQIR